MRTMVLTSERRLGQARKAPWRTTLERPLGHWRAWSFFYKGMLRELGDNSASSHAKGDPGDVCEERDHWRFYRKRHQWQY